MHNKIFILAPNLSENPFEKVQDENYLQVIKTGLWEDLATHSQMRIVNLHENYIITLRDVLGEKLMPIPVEASKFDETKSEENEFVEIGPKWYMRVNRTELASEYMRLLKINA